MIYITRKEHFSASHILKNDNFNETDNLNIFGKCNSMHGHNYYLEVKLRGIPDKSTGFIFDLKELKIIINREIIDKVDHKFLNELALFKGINPTTENIAIVFYNILKDKVISPNASLYSVKIFETEKNCAEYIEEPNDK